MAQACRPSRRQHPPSQRCCERALCDRASSAAGVLRLGGARMHLIPLGRWPCVSAPCRAHCSRAAAARTVLSPSDRARRLQPGAA